MKMFPWLRRLTCKPRRRGSLSKMGTLRQIRSGEQSPITRMVGMVMGAGRFMRTTLTGMVAEGARKRIDVPEEDGREPQHEAQEEGEDDEVPGDKVNDGGTCWSNMHPVTGFIPSYVGTTVDHYLDLLDSNLSSLEDSDEEQEGEQEGEQEEGGQDEDMKQQDTGEEDGEEEAGGEEAGKEEAGEEEDALEKDVVQKDVVWKDVVEEDLQILSLRRSAH